MNDLNKFTITVLTLGILLLGYSQLAERMPINFFWESRYIGIQLLISTAVTLIVSRSSIYFGFRKIEWKTGLAIAFQVTYLIVISLITLAEINSLNHLTKVKKLLSSNDSIIETVGQIESFGFVIQGDERSLNNDGFIGEYEIIVYGSKRTVRTKVGIEHMEGRTKVVIDRRSR